jgi:hypothetical protein
VVGGPVKAPGGAARTEAQKMPSSLSLDKWGNPLGEDPQTGRHRR